MSARRGFLASLVPTLDDKVSPEFYRLSGKLRMFTNIAFLVANFVMAPQVESLGFDLHVHWRFFLAICSVHVVDAALGLAIWRGHWSARALRRLTLCCAILEALAVVGASWVYGSVNSPFLGIELVFISIYRLAFDQRVGLASFLTILLGQWAVVALEQGGVLPPQPINPGTVDAVYLMPARALGAMIYLSFALALTFVVAHWAVARMRHKDVAIRMLRDSLYAEAGKIGRHSGRTLRDTYLLGPLLGTGGMGEVYSATHLRTRRAVAVKLLHTHLVEDPRVLSRFRREAEITGKLGSDNIVHVIDVDEDDGQPFLVLELLEGESLAARIKRQGMLPVGEIASIVEPIASALDLAHRAGVVHRDLKPENVFLCPRPDGGTTVKLLDFGVSKMGGTATAITRDVSVIGTPDYMSPEQAGGDTDDVAAASDLFSLGSVIYTMLTAQRPFVAESVPAVLRKILDEEPLPILDLDPDVPRDVVHVVAIAMAKRPADRYATAAELARDLRAAADGKAPPALAERARGLVRGKTASRRSRRDSMSTGQTQPAEATRGIAGRS
ncbi:MAG TPA: serine/threonine-protein kinase [Kofleriaceae bacterium]|nr:serine/threonine-protein kinase [Kofleriaceae bacterium]